MIQYTTRFENIDCGHRVMKHESKCNNYHGHTYIVYLTMAFDVVDNDLGYQIDFNEIKRLGFGWLQKFMDHGFLANPKDKNIIDLVHNSEMKLYIMSLRGEKYCNPSAENISKEIFLAMEILLGREHLSISNSMWIYKVKLYETPRNFVECVKESITSEERENFSSLKGDGVKRWKEEQGIKLYKK